MASRLAHVARGSGAFFAGGKGGGGRRNPGRSTQPVSGSAPAPGCLNLVMRLTRREMLPPRSGTVVTHSESVLTRSGKLVTQRPGGFRWRQRVLRAEHAAVRAGPQTFREDLAVQPARQDARRGRQGMPFRPRVRVPNGEAGPGSGRDGFHGRSAGVMLPQFRRCRECRSGGRR